MQPVPGYHTRSWNRKRSDITLRTMISPGRKSWATQNMEERTKYLLNCILVVCEKPNLVITVQDVLEPASYGDAVVSAAAAGS